MMPGFDWICAGLSRASMPPAGSPGMSRGNRKFSVTATHSANSVEAATTDEPAHRRSPEYAPAGGARAPARRVWRFDSVTSGHGPVCAPGQIRVNERTLSGNVVKIGSP